MQIAKPEHWGFFLVGRHAQVPTLLLVWNISQCVKSKTPLWLMVDLVRFLYLWVLLRGGPLGGHNALGFFPCWRSLKIHTRIKGELFMSRKWTIFWWGLLGTRTPHCGFCAFGCCFCLDFGPFFLSSIVFLLGVIYLFIYLFGCMGGFIPLLCSYSICFWSQWVLMWFPIAPTCYLVILNKVVLL